MPSVGYATLQVIPVIKGVTKNIEGQLSAATGGLKSAGIGKAISADMSAGVAAASASVESASAKVARARVTEQNAAGSLRVAELQLTEIRDKEGASASAVAAAEERVAKAQRTASTAAASYAAASTELSTAQERAAATGDAAAVSTEKVGKAHTGAMAGVKGLVGAMAGMLVVTKGYEFFKDATADADAHRKVMDLTAAAIKSTGGAAGVTSKDVQELSEKLALQAGVTDDASESVANMVLRFTNIKDVGPNKIFDQTTQAALDLSAATGRSATASAMALGRALNDPVKGLSALTRSGITFTAAQQKQIKAMAQSGNLLGAQKMILEQVSQKYGGAAAAAATPAERLHTIMDRFQVSVGSALIPILDRLTRTMTTVFGFMAAHTNVVKGLATALGVLAAGMAAEKIIKWSTAIKESTVVTKLSALATKAWAAAQAVFNAVMDANPIMLVVAAVAALVAGFVIAYKRSATFRAIVAAAFHGVEVAAAAVADFFTKDIPAAFSRVLAFARQWGPLILTALVPFIGLPLLVWQHWSQITGYVSRALNTALAIARSVSNAIRVAVLAVWGAIVAAVRVQLAAVTAVVRAQFNAALLVVRTVSNAARVAFTASWNAIVAAARVLAGAVTAAVRSSLNAATVAVRVAVAAARAAFVGAWNAIVAAARVLAGAVLAAARSAFNALLAVVRSATNAARVAFTAGFNAMLATSRAVWGAVSAAVRGAVNAIVGAVNRVAGAARSAASGVRSATGAIGSAFASAYHTVASWVSSIGSAVAGMPGRIASIGGAMFSAGAGIVRALWNGLKSVIGGAAGFASNLGSAVKNAVNSALGLPRTIGGWKMGAGPVHVTFPHVTIPALAGGGMTTGLTGALLGDNPSGQEAVLPLDSQRTVNALSAALALALPNQSPPSLSGLRLKLIVGAREFDAYVDDRVAGGLNGLASAVGYGTAR